MYTNVFSVFGLLNFQCDIYCCFDCNNALKSGTVLTGSVFYYDRSQKKRGFLRNKTKFHVRNLLHTGRFWRSVADGEHWQSHNIHPVRHHIVRKVLWRQRRARSVHKSIAVHPVDRTNRLAQLTVIGHTKTERPNEIP